MRKREPASGGLDKPLSQSSILNFLGRSGSFAPGLESRATRKRPRNRAFPPSLGRGPFSQRMSLSISSLSRLPGAAHNAPDGGVQNPAPTSLQDEAKEAARDVHGAGARRGSENTGCHDEQRQPPTTDGECSPGRHARGVFMQRDEGCENAAVALPQAGGRRAGSAQKRGPGGRTKKNVWPRGENGKFRSQKSAEETQKQVVRNAVGPGPEDTDSYANEAYTPGKAASHMGGNQVTDKESGLESVLGSNSHASPRTRDGPSTRDEAASGTKLNCDDHDETTESSGQSTESGRGPDLESVKISLEEGDANGRVNSGEDESMCEYERQRQERIRRNRAFMATLGLDTFGPSGALKGATSRRAGATAQGRTKPASRAKPRAPAVPLRRSTRGRGADEISCNESLDASAAPSAATRSSAREPHSAPVLEEVDFDESSVVKYLCENPPARCHRMGEVVEAAPPDGRIVGLRTVEAEHPLAAAGLSTVYSMHFRYGGRVNGSAPPLLAAGGKGGVMALFSATMRQHVEQSGARSVEDGQEDTRTLMNFKAHKGWVSAVRFVDVGRGGESTTGGSGTIEAGCGLLSSANDSVVKLWDISKQHRGMPRLLCSNGDLHPSRKGIFAMDSRGTLVVTGSKDATVGVASLLPTGLLPERVLGGTGGNERAFHSKVVKGISLRNDVTVASCGDDSRVRVYDLRASVTSGPTHSLDDVHDSSCHTVRWHPVDDHLLLTAGLDPEIKLFDIRRLGNPLHAFRGHCPFVLARPKAIHRPEFLRSGASSFSIITCGERSDKLSLYDSSTGATVSRGVLGDEASALAASSGDGSAAAPGATGTVAAAMPGGGIVLLNPVRLKT